ncbi:MAG: N-acetyl-alpha-D-glucosaminyl L-malate synthase BshA [Candidatus Heimdallarchaeota archaeon]|nr:N-acetyl-alpha-D-glucosaminyl L-malate synthase BshA [Candidatus Heimdallarchaeota archaeon]
MKIGINCFPTVGGSGIVATQLAIDLAKKGHDIHLISYDTPFLLRTSRHPNITLDLVDILSYPLFRDIGAPYTILAASKLVNIVKKWDLDLLHIHYAIPVGVSAYLAKNITKIPVALTAHGSDIHTLGVDPAYNPVISHVFENVDGLSTVSNYLKMEIEANFEAKKDIEVLYNPIDTEKYRRIDVQLCDFRIKYEKNFVHVSNFRTIKNTPFIVESFAEIVKAYPEVGLIMVGEGPERKRCEDIANKLGIREHVSFQGVRTSITSIYNCGSALLSASTNESFGLTIAEAMSCESPVIAPNVGGIPEVLDHKTNGFIYELGNKSEFIEHMSTLLDDESLVRKMGEKGRQKVIDKFESSKIADRYVKWYTKILDEL